MNILRYLLIVIVLSAGFSDIYSMRKRHQNNGNAGNQKLQKTNAPQCWTIRCKQDCAPDGKGGYFNYCGKSCIPKGQLCLTPGCYKGCAKNGNFYFDFCSISCRDVNSSSAPVHSNNNQQKFCIVCGVKPVNTNFPGTLYCGNTCKLNALKNTNVHSNTNQQKICALVGCNKSCYAGFDYCGKTHGQLAKLQTTHNSNQQKLCIVCGSKPVNANFPGTQYCGNTCRLGIFKNVNVQSNTNEPVIDPRVNTYLHKKKLLLTHCELFYDDQLHPQNYVFCNFYPCPQGVTVDGITYANAEAAFQAGKLYQGGVPTAMKAVDGNGAFQLGKQGKWAYQGANVDRMKKVLHAKFTQNNQLKQQLKATGTKHLIEDSNRDAFWGIGANGSGENMLGELLMNVRAQI